MVDSAFATAADLALGTRFPRIHAVALQPDGKLLVGAGEELVRLRTDGTLDPTFGTGGVLRVALLVHPDGRIVLTGVEPSSDLRPFVAQLTAAGALDPGFGTKGVVMLKPTLGGVVQPTAAALQADGKILIAGWVRATSLAKKRPAIWRFTSAGLLDAPFGANGEAEAPAGGGDGAFRTVTVLANAKIVAAGFFKASSLPSEAWQVARFTASGELDATFAQAGSTVFNTGLAYSPGGAEALVVTAAGYVVAGRGFSTNDPASFLLARVLP